jgi:hypothetical protein
VTLVEVAVFLGAQDRAGLLEIMATLSIRVYKVRRIAQRESRMAEAQWLSTRSIALRSSEELERLQLGVEGKAAGRLTLRVLAETDERLDPVGWMSSSPGPASGGSSRRTPHACRGPGHRPGSGGALADAS